MSRVEANKEPSMEEILASIREIIAGDPRARPQQTPQRTSPAPASQRGFMSRESFLRSPVPHQRPEPAPERAETYFRPIVPQNEPAAATSRPVRDPLPSGATPRSPDDQAGQSRATPAADAGSSDSTELLAKLNGLAKSTPSSGSGELSKPAARKIDAELSGLVADGIKKPERAGADAAMGSSVANDAAAAASAKNDAQKPSTDAGAATKVSAPEAGATAAPASADDASDPFSFDLGPSPFSVRASTPTSPSTQTENLADDIAASLSKVERGIADIRGTVSRDVSSSFPGPGAATAAQPAAPSSFTGNTSVDPVPRRDAVAVASVAATLGPNSTLEPLSASFDRPASAFDRPSAVSVSAASLTAAGEKLRAPAPLMATPSQVADRALEDTVADLLRPMLKTWLAENMPKIVERALRREINERLLLSEKNAAE